MNHCGACGQRCQVANGTAACVAGNCTVAACNAGFGDCDGDPANGCETDLSASVAHCGACGHACAAGESCVSGECRIVCPASQIVCGLTCIDPNTDPNNCGGCGNHCTDGPICINGAGACLAGLTFCNGICRDLSSDPANCGVCGNICPTGTTCVNGGCV